MLRRPPVVAPPGAARDIPSREVSAFFSGLILKSFVDAEHLARLVG
ncbi:MAG TPA: hypothetical protein VF463_15090 [Sphingobium sp.]